jgi:hypothetical protein
MIVPLHKFDPRIIDKKSGTQAPMLHWVLENAIAHGADEVTFFGVTGGTYRVSGLLQHFDIKVPIKNVIEAANSLSQITAMSFPDLDQSFYSLLEQIYLMKYMSEAK